MKLASLPVRAVAARVYPAVAVVAQVCQAVAEVGPVCRPVAEAGRGYRPAVEAEQVYQPVEDLPVASACSSKQAWALVMGWSLAQDRFDPALASSPERPSPAEEPSMMVK